MRGTRFNVINLLCLLVLMLLAGFIAFAAMLRLEANTSGQITFNKWATLTVQVESAPLGIWIEQNRVEAWRNGTGESTVELALFRDVSSARYAEDHNFDALQHSNLAVESIRGRGVSVYGEEAFDIHLFPESGDTVQMYGFAGDIREIAWITNRESQSVTVTSDGTLIDVEVDGASFEGYLEGSKQRPDDAFVHFSGVHIDQLREHNLVGTVGIESAPSEDPTRFTGLFFGWDLDKPGGNTSIYTSLYATSLVAEAPIEFEGSVRVGSSTFEVLPGDEVSLTFDEPAQVTLEDGSLSFRGKSKDTRLGGDQLVGSVWDGIPEVVQAAVWIAVGALLAPAALTVGPVVRRWHRRRD